MGTQKNESDGLSDGFASPFSRILGLCLLQNELCPITLNRHVIKVLLGRKVRTQKRFPFVFLFPPLLYSSHCLVRLVVASFHWVPYSELSVPFFHR